MDAERAMFSRNVPVVVVGALLALLVPTLLMAAPDTPATALAVLAAVLVSLVGSAGWFTPVAGGEPASALTDHGQPLVRPGRVADPAHHPLHPRAPGPA